ncbi:MAG TPA: hypothetical protein DCS49_04595, partial [Gammaproteobacteria bacterium]|nr:hypothetical protein [Gammaproteobacteria bacterium]
PTTGTAPLYINQQLVSPNGTDINVHFDNQGEATLTTQYNDVGQIQISAQYQDDSGFIIQGEQRVIHTPESLVLYRNDNDHQCHSIDAQCSRFQKAGESFDLAIKAVCWQQDNDNNYRDNPTTPNFQLNDIAMTSTVIAPETGSNGTLAVETVDFSADDKGEKNIQQSLSEVGIFELSLSPPAYFGQNISVTPLTVGRFYPHSLGITMLNNDYAAAGECDFVYSGQPFSLTPDPLITVIAYNTNAEVTTNYRDDFAPLSVDDIRYTMPSTDDQQLGTTGTPLQIHVPDNEPTLDHSNGSLSFSFSGYEYQYLKQANSQIAPFTSQMTIRFNEIRDRDGITTASPSDITFSGPNIYFGRLSIDS